MIKKFIEAQEKKLKEEKKKLEIQLQSFAEKSNQADSGWDAIMPLYEGGIEGEVDEVEEFDTRLALEKTLEQEFEKIDVALAKIKKGKYGICEKCEKSIPRGRLQAYPQAKLCAKCQ